MDGDLWSGERWGPTWLFTSVCSAHQHQTLASLNMLWCLTFLFNMIILWEEQLVWCGEYKTSQECETALASQYQTLFLVFVFSKFSILIFSPFCQMFEGSWLPKVSHCVQVLKCHSLTNSLSDQKPGPSSDLYACCNFVFVFVFVFCYDEQRKTWAQAVFVVRMLVSPAASGRGSRRPNTSWTVLLSHPTISLLLSDLCFKFFPKTMTNCNFKKLDVRDLGFLVSYFRRRCKLCFKFKLKLELSHYVHV